MSTLKLANLAIINDNHKLGAGNVAQDVGVNRFCVVYFFSKKKRGNRFHIGGQVVLGLQRVALQYGSRRHGVAMV